MRSNDGDDPYAPLTADTWIQHRFIMSKNGEVYASPPDDSALWLRRGSFYVTASWTDICKLEDGRGIILRADRQAEVYVSLDVALAVALMTR